MLTSCLSPSKTINHEITRKGVKPLATLLKQVNVLPSMNSLTRMQHVTYPNIEVQSKIGPSSTSVEQAKLVVPHFRIKWNSPLNVLRLVATRTNPSRRHEETPRSRSSSLAVTSPKLSPTVPPPCCKPGLPLL